MKIKFNLRFIKTLGTFVASIVVLSIIFYSPKIRTAIKLPVMQCSAAAIGCCPDINYLDYNDTVTHSLTIACVFQGKICGGNRCFDQSSNIVRIDAVAAIVRWHIFVKNEAAWQGCCWSGAPDLDPTTVPSHFWEDVNGARDLAKYVYKAYLQGFISRGRLCSDIYGPGPTESPDEPGYIINPNGQCFDPFGTWDYGFQGGYPPPGAVLGPESRLTFANQMYGYDHANACPPPTNTPTPTPTPLVCGGATPYACNGSCWANNCTCGINCPAAGAPFCTACPPPTPYTVSGTVFQDTNKNGVKDVGEGNLAVPVTIYYEYFVPLVGWVTGAPFTTSGSYTINNVYAGVNIWVYSPSGDYTLTYPNNNWPAAGAEGYATSVSGFCSSSPGGPTCSAGNLNNVNFGLYYNDPIGFHDTAACGLNGISGWTCDPSDFTQPLSVHIYTDPSALYPSGFIAAVTANVPREPAVAANCGGNANHGFTFTLPLNLQDGTPHNIYTYAINIGAGTVNPLLGGSPKSISCAVPNFSVDGSVYIDKDKDGVKDGTDPFYTGGFTMSKIVNGVTTSFSVPSGTSNYSLTAPFNNSLVVSLITPSGYQPVFPPVAVGSQQFQMTMTGTCPLAIIPAPPGTQAPPTTCAGGNITNLYFGITNSNPWEQFVGFDARFDGGYSRTIPDVPAYGPPVALRSFDDAIPATGGVFYVGNGSANFGSATVKPDVNNWLAGSSLNPEKYTTTKSDLHTSYANLLALAQSSGQTISPLTSKCTITSSSPCDLHRIDSSGVYQVSSGDVYIDVSNFNRANIHVVILGAQDIYLKGDIQIPNDKNSSLLISAARDIIVNSNVGQSSFSASPTANISGQFTAGRNFIVSGNGGSCPTSDTQLVIDGGIVVNANLSGGSFTSNRDLCGNDDNPTVIVRKRLDMLINAPEFLKIPTYNFREDAP